MENKIYIKDYMFLHATLLVYSLGGIFSKIASSKEFMSFQFIIYYGLVLLTLVVYALLWQQVLKRFPLTKAFANKAIVIAWGMLWGIIFFQDNINLNKIFGSFIIMLGIIMVVSSDG